jgi:hypothetical protein
MRNICGFNRVNMLGSSLNREYRKDAGAASNIKDDFARKYIFVLKHRITVRTRAGDIL